MGGYKYIALAGLTHSSNIKKYYEANAEGTLNLIKKAEAANVKRFVYISTQAIGLKVELTVTLKKLQKNILKNRNWTGLF